MIEKVINAVKALLLVSVSGMSVPDRIVLFEKLAEIANDGIRVLKAGIEQGKLVVSPTTRADATIAKITGNPVPAPVQSYAQPSVDGRLAMLEGNAPAPTLNKFPVKVATITRKQNGEEKRVDPQTVDGVPKLRKRPFFPGMANNANGLLSYLYYIDNRKVAYNVFTHEILKVLPGLSAKDHEKFKEWGYSVPKKAIRNGECREWTRSFGGKTFKVCVDPKSVN